MIFKKILFQINNSENILKVANFLRKDKKKEVLTLKQKTDKIKDFYIFVSFLHTWKLDLHLFGWMKRRLT